MALFGGSGGSDDFVDWGNALTNLALRSSNSEYRFRMVIGPPSSVCTLQLYTTYAPAPRGLPRTMTYSLIVMDLAQRAALLGSLDNVWSSSAMGGGRFADGSSKEGSLLGFQYGGG